MERKGNATLHPLRIASCEHHLRWGSSHPGKGEGAAPLAWAFLALALSFAWAPLRGEELTAPITVQGDELHWLKERELLEVKGHVRVLYQEGWIEADTAVVNFRTHEVRASGNVRWHTPQVRGSAREITMNTQTLEGELKDGVLLDPLGAQVKATRILRTAKNRYLVEEGSFTTCHCPDQRVPSWEITWSKAHVRWREDFWFTHGLFWANGVPVLYLPAGYSSFLGKRTPGVLFPRIGYASRYGFFLEPGFFYPVGDHADLTMKWLFTEQAGEGFSLMGNFLSYTGSWSLNGLFFQESPHAPYLRQERRGPSQRWSLIGTISERPFSLLRLSMNTAVFSDTLQQRDFANNLQSLTAHYSLSNLSLSGEKDRLGSLLLRFSLSQALLSPTSTGSRFPTLWLRLDPARFDPLPLWVAGDLRFDQFFSFKPSLGLPWQPLAYRREGRRFSTHFMGGAGLDLLPGLRSEVQAGVMESTRDQGLSLPVSNTTLFYVATDSHLRLFFYHPYFSTRFEPGLQTLYSPGQTPVVEAVIEDQDRLAFQRWLVPYVRWVSLLPGGGVWENRISSPLSTTTGARGVTAGAFLERLILTTRLTSAFATLTMQGILRNRNDLPQLYGSLRIPLGGNALELGYNRIVTEGSGTLYPVALGTPSPFADDPVTLISTHELFTSLTFAIRRFSGTITLRRRIASPDAPAAGWVQREFRIRYTSPCQCWFAELHALDFPGTIADRVEFLVELARLGGVGIQPVQP